MRLEGNDGTVIKVIEDIASDWERIAYALKFSPGVVRSIRKDTNRQCEDACEEVLYRWLEGAEGTLRPISWQTLIRVLNDCGKGTVAGKLRLLI